MQSRVEKARWQLRAGCRLAAKPAASSVCHRRHPLTWPQPKRHRALYCRKTQRALYSIGVDSSWLGLSVSIWTGWVTVAAVILAPLSLAKRTPCSTALAARADPSVGVRIFLNSNPAPSLFLSAPIGSERAGFRPAKALSRLGRPPVREV